jgi:general stress protein YciG
MANTSKRGFASMDPAKQREIASKGGRAAHAKGTAHEFSSDEARVAGRKGGEAVSRDRAHMSAIGREGGHSRGRARQAQPEQEALTSGVVIDNERPSFGHERANDRGGAGLSGSSAGQRADRSESNRNDTTSFPNRGQI